MSKASLKHLTLINQRNNREYIDKVIYKANLSIEQKKKASQKD